MKHRTLFLPHHITKIIYIYFLFTMQIIKRLFSVYGMFLRQSKYYAKIIIEHSYLLK